MLTTKRLISQNYNIKIILIEKYTSTVFYCSKNNLITQLIQKKKKNAIF